MNPLPDLPLVSIVTPSWNTGPYIGDTLRSVQAQDYPRVEHLVLDSGSTDETDAVLARFPSIHLVRPAPAGLVPKVNLGFAMARGDVVGWLCSDDYYLPGAIGKAVDVLRNNPDVGLVYCNDLLVDSRGVEMRRVRSRQVTHSELVLDRNWVPHATVFMRREALDLAGPLDPRYPMVCDWDLWIRMSKRFPILFVDDWWGAFRVRDDQRSNVHKYESWKEAWKMTREHGAGYFSPYFRNYWRAKLVRAAVMVGRGEFQVAGAKLRDLVTGLTRTSY
ncbi:glycosyltransferase [Ramlibacter humi]|uniref:Glycosyltransferase n=1 Tax=Ramlibacter humi TaxID=2530451 RepID=A0A4Z0BYR0_9BURK|nr:glycosyltransferase [Ramlibacter humi]TFZ03664.1 glycosyltransferase [Ramlibacter humi]